MPSPTARRPSLLNRPPAVLAPGSEQGKANVAIYGIEGRSPEMGLRVTLESGAEYIFPYSTFVAAARQGGQIDLSFGDWRVTCFLTEKGEEEAADVDVFASIFDGLRTQTLLFLRASKEAGFSIEVEEIKDEE